MLTHLKQGSADLDKSVTGFGNALGGLNSFLNELAFKPKGSRESYLFYLPWLNHNVNASFNLADAGGPIQRNLMLISCNGSSSATAPPQIKPFLKTLLYGASVPRPSESPADCTRAEFRASTGCGPEAEE